MWKTESQQSFGKTESLQIFGFSVIAFPILNQSKLKTKFLVKKTTWNHSEIEKAIPQTPDEMIQLAQSSITFGANI